MGALGSHSCQDREAQGGGDVSAAPRVRLHVVSYLLEDDQEPAHECFHTARTAQTRMEELAADARVHGYKHPDRSYFALAPERHVVSVPLTADGIVDAIEGRWRRYALKDGRTPR